VYLSESALVYLSESALVYLSVYSLPSYASMLQAPSRSLTSSRLPCDHYPTKTGVGSTIE
jgi:hypothetical protein